MAVTAAPELCRLLPLSPNFLCVGHGSRNRFSWRSPHTPGRSLHLHQQQGRGPGGCRTGGGEGFIEGPILPQQPAPSTDRAGSAKQRDRHDPGTQSSASEAQTQTVQSKEAFKSGTEKLPLEWSILSAPKLARSLALFPWAPAPSCLKPSTKSL